MFRPSVGVLCVTVFWILACTPIRNALTGGGSSTDTAEAGGGGDDDGPSGPIETGDAGKATPQSATQKAAGLLAGTDNSLPWPGYGISKSQCNTLKDGGELNGQDCVTDFIECDQTIIGHTRGGTKNFSTKWYESNFCTPATTFHDSGDERVYKFSFPDDKEWRAWFTLDTPCADLDVFVIQWDGTKCPTDAHIGQGMECDAKVQDGTARERPEAVTDGNWRNWLVVVEGKDGEEGAFALTAQCRRGVR